MPGKKRKPYKIKVNRQYTVEDVKRRAGAEYKDSALQRALDRELLRRNPNVTRNANRRAAAERKRRGK